MYLANLYRGWRGGPASFLSGTTSAASRHNRPSSPASCLLRTLGERPFLPGMPNLEASGPASAQLTSQLAPSFSPRPSSHPLPPHPHRAPSSQSNLRPQVLDANSISPRPKASPGKTQGGPQPRVSHHRGSCLGRKAEVRKCPASRRLPFRERRSRSLRQHFRGGPFRSGPGRNSLATFGSPGRFHTRTAGTCRRPEVIRKHSRPFGSPYIFCRRPWFLWPWL